MIADKGSFKEWSTDIKTKNFLNYPNYEEKIAEVQEKTHLEEAIKIGEAQIDKTRVVLGVCDARFLMGSMGYVVGEKINIAF